jgi:hypothetical protein
VFARPEASQTSSLITRMHPNHLDVSDLSISPNDQRYAQDQTLFLRSPSLLGSSTASSACFIFTVLGATDLEIPKGLELESALPKILHDCLFADHCLVQHTVLLWHDHCWTWWNLLCYVCCFCVLLTLGCGTFEVNPSVSNDPLLFVFRQNCGASNWLDHASFIFCVGDLSHLHD